MMLTPEQIIDISVESGLSGQLRLDSDVSRILSVRRLQKFAEQVADLAAAAEREACAQVCENERSQWDLSRDGWQSAHDCAAAIRDRGEKKEAA